MGRPRANPSVIHSADDPTATFTLASGTLAVVVPDGEHLPLPELQAMAAHLAVDQAFALDDEAAERVHTWLCSRWGHDA